MSDDGSNRDSGGGGRGGGGGCGARGGHVQSVEGGIRDGFGRKRLGGALPLLPRRFRPRHYRRQDAGTLRDRAAAPDSQNGSRPAGHRHNGLRRYGNGHGGEEGGSLLLHREALRKGPSPAGRRGGPP